MTKTPDDIKNALLRMQDLCSRTEKCRFDIKEKLKGLGFSADQTEKIINELIKDKFIDDQRFAGFFVRDKFKFKKWGKIKIGYSLKMKKIAPEIIDEALSSIDEDEYRELIINELKKKNSVIKEKNQYKRKAKLFQFAAGRGFESGLIYEAIDKINED